MKSYTKWDLRFLELARHIAGWSKDPSTKCAAVIVRPDNTVCSVGYNGFPPGVSDAPELYADRATKLSRTNHAELNAILHAREPLVGYTLYSPAPTCDRCAGSAISVGISRVVCDLAGHWEFAERWNTELQSALMMYAEAGVETLMLDEENECCS